MTNGQTIAPKIRAEDVSVDAEATQVEVAEIEMREEHLICICETLF